MLIKASASEINEIAKEKIVERNRKKLLHNCTESELEI